MLALVDCPRKNGRFDVLSSPSQTTSASGTANRLVAASARVDEIFANDSTYFLSPPSPLMMTRCVCAAAGRAATTSAERPMTRRDIIERHTITPTPAFFYTTI